MTHFLPEALTRCRNGSSGEGLKAGRTHLPLVSGRLMTLCACTGSPSSVTRKSSRSRKFCTPVASSFPMSPPLTAARNQGADITLAKIGDALDAKPPIEQHRRRPGQEKQGGAPEYQEGQKSRRHPQSVAREI